MRSTLFALLGLFGLALVLVGCSEQDAANAQAAAAGLQTSGVPLLVTIGGVTSALISLIGGHFISKSNVQKNDLKEYSDDDVAAMIRGIEKAGYVINKRG